MSNPLEWRARDALALLDHVKKIHGRHVDGPVRGCVTCSELLVACEYGRKPVSQTDSPHRVDLEAVEAELLPRARIQARLIAGNLGEESTGQEAIVDVMEALIAEVRFLRDRLGL